MRMILGLYDSKIEKWYQEEKTIEMDEQSG